MTPVHFALVVNPTAGKGRASRSVGPVVDRLRAGGAEIDVITGSDASEALERARDAVREGVDGLAVLGGDGMVHLGVQAVVGTSTPLGIVPAGTGNDFAASLGLPVGAPLVAADVLLRGHVRTVDAVSTSAGTWYAGVLGAGFDSAVNERANRMHWPRGQRRYELAIAAELRTFRPLPFTLCLDGQPWETEAMLVAVGNAPRYGGGMRIAPDAVLDDGLLDVTVVGPIGTLAFVRVFPSVYKGTHINHPAVTVRRAREVRVACAGVTAYADGERLAELPLTVTCEPGALRVFG